MKKSHLLGALCVGIISFLTMSSPAFALTADDVKCSKCVNKRNIAKQAVTASKIKPAAVTSEKIRDNAVTSLKIEDGSVTVDDLSPDLLGAISRQAESSAIALDKGLFKLLEGRLEHKPDLLIQPGPPPTPHGFPAPIGTIWIDSPARAVYICSETQNDLCVFWSLIPQPVKTYAVGNVGPAGGRVFFVTPDGLHGYEMAPEIAGSAVWGCPHPFFGNNTGATSTNLGSGVRNVAQVIPWCNGAASKNAMAIADVYVSPSNYHDWYLPSAGEAFEMNAILSGTGNVLWSSSEARQNSDMAVSLAFDGPSPTVSETDKTAARAVWPIRAF